MTAPTVHALNPNGSVRSCCDFSVTINPHLQVDMKYLLDRVGESCVFSQIGLASANLKLPIVYDSMKYLVINTQEGLPTTWSIVTIHHCVITQALRGINGTWPTLMIFCYFLIVQPNTIQYFGALSRAFIKIHH